jgi:hypothetical protein
MRGECYFGWSQNNNMYFVQNVRIHCYVGTVVDICGRTSQPSPRRLFSVTLYINGSFYVIAKLHHRIIDNGLETEF